MSCLSNYQRRVDRAEEDCCNTISDLENSSGSEGEGRDHYDEVMNARQALVDEIQTVIADMESHISELQEYVAECKDTIAEVRIDHMR